MNIEELKNRLITEKEELLIEIKKISKVSNGEYIAVETTTNNDDVSDFGDQGAEQANFSDNQAILVELEARLNNIDDALTRIESGVYGQCTKCGKDISEKRILANAAASLCIECAGADKD